METKQLLFIALTLGFIPTAVAAGMAWQWAEKALVAGAFFSTCYLVDINFVSMELYRGDTRGFEFGLTDWMIISLAFIMMLSPRWKARKLQLPPGTLLLSIYVLIAVISLIEALVPIYAGFGLVKILRGILVFYVAYNYLHDEKQLRFVIYILVAIVAIEFLYVLEQRLAGMYRAKGTTPHSNTLAGYINMLNMIFFALLLGDSKQSKWYWAALAMGSLMVMASFSRGAMSAMIAGYLLVIILSYKDRIDARKTKILLILALLTLPVALKTGPAIVERFLYAPEEAGESRMLANVAAITMANDHVFGVGLNNYSYAINETLYIRFIDSPVDRGIVHNIFLLHACEMGWIGMIVFLLIKLLFIQRGLQSIGASQSRLAGSFAVGTTVAIIVLTLQGSLEWFFRQTYITIEFFMLAGFLLAVPKVQRNYQKSTILKKMALADYVNRISTLQQGADEDSQYSPQPAIV